MKSAVPIVPSTRRTVGVAVAVNSISSLPLFLAGAVAVQLKSDLAIDDGASA